MSSDFDKKFEDIFHNSLNPEEDHGVKDSVDEDDHDDVSLLWTSLRALAGTAVLCVCIAMIGMTIWGLTELFAR